MKLHGPKIKIARRLGIALTPKSAKYLDRRPYPPGQHGQSRKPGKQSNYKRQLLEKQKLRAQYNVGERQLANYFERATAIPGSPVGALVQLLETRLDALVLRAGFARTIFAARQYVRHGHILVNGKRVSVPGYQVEPGDVITVAERSRQVPQIVEAIRAGARPPGYLEVDTDAFRARLRELPTPDQVPIQCQLPLVIEFYSR
ncbi:MAG TPA: 30S ribosomal protein S4 [Gemmatimonadales bacterium]|nr:30S ribosomal protein S4 [Gemmatimonadales bacterium]